MTPYPKFSLLVSCALTIFVFQANAQNESNLQLESDFELINQIDLIFDEIRVQENVTDIKTDLNDKNDSFKIFPTPATDFFQINSKLTEFDQVQITIYSSGGKRISTQKLSSANYKVDISDFSSGSYYVFVFRENQLLSNPIPLTVTE